METVYKQIGWQSAQVLLMFLLMLLYFGKVQYAQWAGITTVFLLYLSGPFSVSKFDEEAVDDRLEQRFFTTMFATALIGAILPISNTTFFAVIASLLAPLAVLFRIQVQTQFDSTFRVLAVYSGLMGCMLVLPEFCFSK